MAYLNEVTKSKNYNNYKLTADKVIQILDNVRDERTKSRRRWIWELMQNAKDVPNIFDAVSITIDLSEKEFKFSHNGNPFKVENITGLIQQVSTGKPSDSTNKRITGKFGTGFISTHLLSDTVQIKGIVEVEGNKLPPKKFEICLNRKGSKSEELIPHIKEELEKLDKIDDDLIFEPQPDYHQQRVETNRDTIFLYPLEDDESLDAAKMGVKDLANTLAQTLIFIEEIKQITVNNHIDGKYVTYYKEKIETGLSNYFTATIASSDEMENLHFVVYQDEKIHLALQIKDLKSKEIIHNDNAPRLFRDFPLVGTEKFYFPFILNGLTFFPTEKRDNILLTGSSDKPTHNRSLIEYAIEKSIDFVSWLIENDFSNFPALALSGMPSISEEKTKEWYKENIQSYYRENLLGLNIMETSHENIALKDGYIPFIPKEYEKDSFAANDIFWDIVVECFGDDYVCKREQLKDWQKYLGTYNELGTWKDENIERDNIFFKIEDLLIHIQEAKSLSELKIAVATTENEKIKWLNKVYKFLIDLKFKDLFNEYSIVLNKNNVFKPYSILYTEKDDKKIDEEFLVILKKMNGEDWNDSLIHHHIIEIEPNHNVRELRDISAEINRLLESKYEIGDSYWNKKTVDFLELDNALDILFEILLIETTSDKTGVFQRELFKLSKEYFDRNEEPKVLKNIQDFNFHIARRLLVEYLNSKIEEFTYSSDLPVSNPKKWLNAYIQLKESNIVFKEQLETSSIVPNRLNEFCHYDHLYNNGTENNRLDNELIVILSELGGEDWNEVLIADYITLELPHTKTFDELANSIQEQIKQMGSEFVEHSKALLNIINWYNQADSKKQGYFEYLRIQKDRIFVSISLDNHEIGGHLARLISNPEKLETLAYLAENIDIEDLESIAHLSKENRLVHYIEQAQNTDYLSENLKEILDNANRQLVIENKRQGFIETLKKTEKEKEKYSLEWFLAYLELLETFNSVDTESSSYIDFYSIERYIVDGKNYEGFYILKGGSKALPVHIETYRKFELSIPNHNNILDIDSISIQGQNLIIYIQKGLPISVLSQLERIRNVKINFDATFNLFSTLKNGFKNVLVKPWSNIIETLPKLHFIYGPPGTGKTHTLGERIHLAYTGGVKTINNEEFDEVGNSNLKVLVLTPTNKAADVFAKRLINRDANMKVVRLGQVTDPELMELDKDIYIQNMNSSDFNNLNVLASTIHRLPFTTISGEETGEAQLFQKQWDIIVFDECSMISLPYIVFALMALQKYNPECKYYLAGDPKQIPPIFDITDVEVEKLDLEDENIYKVVNLYNFETKEITDLAGIGIVEPLTIQYRSVPTIGELFNQFSYNGLLTHKRSESPKALPESFSKQIQRSVTWIDYPVKEGDNIYKPRKLFYSNYHVYVSLLVYELVKSFDKATSDEVINKKWRIGIISPYKAQVSIIEKLMLSANLSDNLDVSYGTVHSFQGDEREIIIYVVNPSNSNNFVHEKSLIAKEFIHNVAISRAEDYLWIIAPKNYNSSHLNKLKSIEGNSDKSFSHLQIEKFIQKNNGVSTEYLEGRSKIYEHEQVNLFTEMNKDYYIVNDNRAIDFQIRETSSKPNDILD